MNNTLPQNISNSSVWQDQDTFANMNRIPSNPPNVAQRHMSGSSSQSKSRNGYHGLVDNAVPVSASAAFFTNGTERHGGVIPGPPSFDLARSPPGGTNKNTKHVPCKFFRQGTCQAGSACPFSHSMDPVTQQAPCKYFMKGNCKFGAKCALAHFLPDGRRVNRPDLEVPIGMAGRSFSYTNRSDIPPFTNQDSSLVDPMSQQPQYGTEYFPSQPFPLMDPDEPDAFQDRYNQYQNPSNYDSALNSPPTSQFGSPQNESYLLKSPTSNLRTALNAPLPQSFDANSISHIAKYGPLGQSVPDKFGLRSPASSSLSRQLGSPPDSVSAFRNNALGSNLRNVSPLGASPQNVDESIGQRIMHSQKPTKSRGLSASVPRSNLPHDWEEGFGAESDLLPNSLHDEVLTPQERVRRHSRPEQDQIPRDQATGMAIPSGSSSKVGSPAAAGSPSRFSALWAEQREKKAAAETTGPGPFGHVGSPLRESWMPSGSYEAQRGQISGISQQMARLQLNRTDSSDSNNGRSQPNTQFQPVGSRQSSAPIGRFDRTISSPGLNSRRLDEEGEGVFFPMDDDKRVGFNWPVQPQAVGVKQQPENPNSGQAGNNINYNDRSKPIFGFRS